MAMNGGSQYIDNAYYYSARAYTDSADCASAQQSVSDLAAFDPQSPELQRAQDYLANNGC